jgi:hypothetical protein
LYSIGKIQNIGNSIIFRRIAKTAINCKDSNLLFSNRKNGSKGIRKEEPAKKGTQVYSSVIHDSFQWIPKE